MIDFATLDRWLVAPAEHEHLEFKEAKQQYDTTKLLRYCVALANEQSEQLGPDSNGTIRFRLNLIY